MDPLVVKERRVLWLNRIQSLSESGMTQKEWCENEGIPRTTLRYWIGKLRLEEKPSHAAADGNWLELRLLEFRNCLTIIIGREVLY